ncbi:RNA-binding protein [Marinobacterium aestuarii]|uniref:Heat shock protein 15 n=1 Tax=Marinobacterium aestuarii TaxID=1821621 RepID=A0A1A9F4M7_9GAMM|nr:ribosome-associated heat shock protein Hsp15 [Marinobacterium aestuarii]ANG64838.1 RNA-binding protein [Marinobacterium aestuarii]
MSEAQEHRVRLDKWLWAARFYRTRATAKDMIEGGKVHYSGQRSKCSKLVEVGAMLQIRQGMDMKEIEILQLSDQRRGAPEAQQLYRETPESVAKREKLAAERKLNGGSSLNPRHQLNKKDRRQIRSFKERQAE